MDSLGGINILLSFKSFAAVLDKWWSVLLCFRSLGHWQVIEECMGHSSGDGWSRAVRLCRWLHRRAHQGLPVWCVFTSRQGTRSALPCTTHRFVIHTCTYILLLLLNINVYLCLFLSLILPWWMFSRVHLDGCALNWAALLFLLAETFSVACGHYVAELLS